MFYIDWYNFLDIERHMKLDFAYFRNKSMEENLIA